MMQLISAQPSVLYEWTECFGWLGARLVAAQQPTKIKESLTEQLQSLAGQLHAIQLFLSCAQDERS